MSSVREALALALAGRTDISLVLLFGSAARGDTNSGSDVDVAVDADTTVDLLALGRDLTRALGREVDVVALRGAEIPLLEEIVRDGVVVHQGQPSGHGRWLARTLALLETDRPWFARVRDGWLRRVARRGL